MGFDPQLREILYRLPKSRQSLLFSATLPSSVADFVKAGLVNPVLIRLDTDQKISPDLSMSFFLVKPSEKDGALLVVLDHILQISTGSKTDQTVRQAIIFTCTKHHVEYLTSLLELAGYPVAHIYGSLHQTARHQQLERFRAGEKSVLVVTDVAARGLDIPIMENVINYDFAASSRVFVHRVGRTARAGRHGSAWSFVTRAELPYLHDLETFLGIPPLSGTESNHLGMIPNHLIDDKSEYVHCSLDETDPHLDVLRQVMRRGQTMYIRSRSKASSQAYCGAKAFNKRLDEGEDRIPTHPAFPSDNVGDNTGALARLLSSVQAYKPSETVLDIATHGQTSRALRISRIKKQLEYTSRQAVQPYRHAVKAPDLISVVSHAFISSIVNSEADEEFDSQKSFKDPDFFLSHTSDALTHDKA